MRTYPRCLVWQENLSQTHNLKNAPDLAYRSSGQWYKFLEHFVHHRSGSGIVSSSYHTARIALKVHSLYLFASEPSRSQAPCLQSTFCDHIPQLYSKSSLNQCVSHRQHLYFTSSLFAGVGGHERDTLLDVLLQVSQASLNELRLVGVNLADVVDLLNTAGAEFDLGGKELNTLVLEQRAVDESRLDDTLLALSSAEDRVSHTGTSHGHGEGSGTSALLSLDDLITTELDTLDELGVGAQVGVVALAEKRNNGDTGVTTNNSDLLIGGVGTLELADETGSANDIESGDTEQAFGVVDAASLEDLGADGHSRVDGVGDDQEVGLRSGLSGSLSKVTDDGGVGVEKIVTGHARLSGDTGGDQDNIGTLQCGGKAGRGRLVTLDSRFGVDVRNIGSDTCTPRLRQ